MDHCRQRCYSISTAGNGYIEVPDGHRHQAGHRDLRREGHRRGWREGFRLRFDHRPRRVRRPGRGASLLTQNFGKFPWGGDCIGQKAGVTTADKTVANLSLDNETVSVSAGTNASIGGITSTVATATRHSTAPSAWRMDGLPELYVLNPVGRCERQCRRAAGNLTGAEHPRGLRPADLQGRHLGRSPRPGHGGHLRRTTGSGSRRARWTRS
ncbi:MAG: hypothetical protein ACLT1W_00945 [Alistipes onderdonkii]